MSDRSRSDGIELTDQEWDELFSAPIRDTLKQKLEGRRIVMDSEKNNTFDGPPSEENLRAADRPKKDNRILGPEVIASRFGFHKATLEGPNATAPKHSDLRFSFMDFANYLDRVLPPGRSKAIVLERLEEASMWAHKSIAYSAPVVDETTPD